MSTVDTGWLIDNAGKRFAPTTLITQVITKEGKTLETLLQDQMSEIETYINETFLGGAW